MSANSYRIEKSKIENKYTQLEKPELDKLRSAYDADRAKLTKSLDATLADYIGKMNTAGASGLRARGAINEKAAGTGLNSGLRLRSIKNEEAETAKKLGTLASGKKQAEADAMASAAQLRKKFSEDSAAIDEKYTKAKEQELQALYEKYIKELASGSLGALKGFLTANAEPLAELAGK